MEKSATPFDKGAHSKCEDCRFGYECGVLSSCLEILRSSTANTADSGVTRSLSMLETEIKERGYAYPNGDGGHCKLKVIGNIHTLSDKAIEIHQMHYSKKVSSKSEEAKP